MAVAAEEAASAVVVAVGVVAVEVVAAVEGKRAIK